MMRLIFPEKKLNLSYNISMMKNIKYFTGAILLAMLFFACQRELDFAQDGIAHGTLKSATTGDCLPSTINGIYRKDTALNATNFIDVQVDLTAIGTYEIKSDTINGYSFRGTGTFGNIGLNTVRLYGSGTPQNVGTDDFTISFDGHTCLVSVPVIGANTGAAVFTLSGAPGSCSGAIVNGTYTENQVLSIDNTVTLTVNVTQTGTYAFGAASVNGMLFWATGVFPSTGLQSVTLNGTGMPQAAGAFNITALNGSSTCTFSITVLPASASTAVYSLVAAGGACSGASYVGTYTQGVPLNSSNSVLINVNVTTPGTYNISTNTVNGMTFGGTGTFSGTGQQGVVLNATGTPTNAGIFNFDVTAGTSTCTFSITVSGATTEEYMLFTANSNFSQRMVGGAPDDTLYMQVHNNPIVINSNTYTIYRQLETGNPIDSSYFRKDNGKYYNLLNTASLGFNDPNRVDYMMLDSSLAANATWTSDLGSNTTTVGSATVPVNIKVVCTILEKGVSATIAGNSYSNVIKVKYVFSYNAGAGDIDFQENQIWFAKGKGFIYFKVNNIPVTVTAEEETTRIQVF